MLESMVLLLIKKEKSQKMVLNLVILNLLVDIIIGTPRSISEWEKEKMTLAYDYNQMLEDLDLIWRRRKIHI